MIFDLIVLAILIIPMASGLNRGFMNMIMRALGWIIAVAAGFILAGTAADYLEKNMAAYHMQGNASDAVSPQVITVIAFVIIVLLVKLMLHIFVRPASRSKKHSVLKLPDMLLGMAIGGAKGIVVVFVFMAVLVPIIAFAEPQTSARLVQELDDSYIAGTLYDNNLLLLIMKGLFE